MPAFAYRAVTTEGRTLQGVEEAVSIPALERVLSGRGLYPLDVAPARGREESGDRPRGWLVGRRVDAAEGITTLAALLDAGLPLERALEVAGRGAARADVGTAWEAVRRQVREGGRLADALVQHPRCFPPVAVGLVRAGERGGHLAEAVRRLAEHLERERALRAKLLSAMIYPLLLIGVGAAALTALLLFVIPRFVELLADAGTELPTSTRALLASASFLGRFWPLMLIGMVAGAGALVAWYRTPSGRLQAHTLLLRLPLIGALRARRATSQLARTLATLLAGGLPLVPSLEIAAETTGDAAVAADVHATREAVRRGETFSAVLRRGRAFPYAFVRLSEVGEETGQLEVLLERAAGLMESELERRMERLVALLEPALILLFGLAVGFVTLSLLQAIYGVHAEGF